MRGMNNLPQNFVFVDTETTGYDNRRDRVIEIGIIKVENGEPSETFHTLLNPNQYVPEFIENYTGISSAELETAPSFDQIADKLLALMEGSVFVAHNVNFDYGFLKNEFLRVGVDFNPDRLCTVRLSRRLYPSLGKYNLSNLIAKLDFDCPNRHRAFDDAHVLWQLYQKARNEFGLEYLVESLNKCIKYSKVPNLLDENIINELPENPGVYIFYGENELPLYIGKSVNIKKRVKSHFTGNITLREQNLHEQTLNIKSISTAGELSALVLESRLIKEMMPVFNRKLRRKTEMVVLKSHLNENGYYAASFERTKKVDSDKGENVLGIFDSLKDCKNALTKASEEYGLCNKLLGLENAMNACFRYHLGKCKGACKCKENPEEYNQRFLMAFKSKLIEEWPFDGPVKIIEKAEDISNYFIVDKWCLIEDNGFSGAGSFDYDIYRIIKDYLVKNPAGVQFKV